MNHFFFLLICLFTFYFWSEIASDVGTPYPLADNFRPFWRKSLWCQYLLMTSIVLVRIMTADMVMPAKICPCDFFFQQEVKVVREWQDLKRQGEMQWICFCNLDSSRAISFHKTLKHTCIAMRIYGVGMQAGKWSDRIQPVHLLRWQWASEWRMPLSKPWVWWHRGFTPFMTV